MDRDGHAVDSPPSFTLSGVVFNDLNANAKRDPKEHGVDRWKVWADLNRDRVRQASDPTATTDEEGRYTFAPLALGSFDLRQEVEPKWRCSPYATDCDKPLELDERGRRKLNKLLAKTLDQALAIAAEQRPPQPRQGTGRLHDGAGHPALQRASEQQAFAADERALTTASGRERNAFMRSLSSRRVVMWFAIGASTLIGGATATYGFAQEQQGAASSELVSRTARETPAIGLTRVLDVSADGRYALLESDAKGLVKAKRPYTWLLSDVYVRDLKTGRTELISGRPDGRFTRDQVLDSGFRRRAGSRALSMSADGRYVLFGSHAGDLTPGSRSDRVRRPTDYVLYLRDRRRAQTRSLGRARQYNAPLLTPDGRLLVFTRPRDRDAVYVRTIASGNTRRVLLRLASGQVERPLARYRFLVSRVSRDGTVALLDGTLRQPALVDLRTGVTELVAPARTFTTPADISADNSRVLFETRQRLSPADRNTVDDCYTLDRASGTIALVTVDAAGKARGGFTCHFVPNTDQIVFSTRATLVPDDTGRVPDAYLRDTTSNVLQLLGGRRSRDRHVNVAAVSADGGTLITNAIVNGQLRDSASYAIRLGAPR